MPYRRRIAPRQNRGSRMPRTLSSLMFSAARRLARLQQRAWAQGASRVAGVGAAGAGKSSPPASAREPSPPANGATRPPFAGTWQTRTYYSRAGQWPLRLSYDVYLPPGIAPNCPMVVMLHGCEQSALEFARGSRMPWLADREGFVLLYPEQSPARQRHRCWLWYQPDAPHGNGEADAIAAIARDCVAAYGVNARRVYIGGLSAGAAMAALTALRHPLDFAAAGLHSGPVLGAARTAAAGLRVMRDGTDFAPQRLLADLVRPGARHAGMPALILHGDDDRVVASRNGWQLFEQFAAFNGLPVSAAGANPAAGTKTPQAFNVVDLPDTGRPIVRLVRIPGLGHAWSGGDAAVPFHAAHGPDASLMLWRFFTDHERGRTPPPG